MELVDDPSRGPKIREIIFRKPSLHALYVEFYGMYQRALDATPGGGKAIEIGAGAGFSQQLIPQLVASDILPYPGLDVIFDATKMPFSHSSLRFICMLNVFHHIPDVSAFLREAERCLLPGGRILILDQHRGWISRWILQYAHNEPYNPASKTWAFETTGPLSGANGALAWMVFERDLAQFHRDFPLLEMRRYRPHTPLRYWLTGGLKEWSLLPMPLFKMARWIDNTLTGINRNIGSFVEIEIVRK